MKLPRNYYNEAVAGIFNARQWGPVLELLRLAQEELDSERRRADEAETTLDAVPDYIAYYLTVAAEGDAPETFANWFNGAR